MTALDRFLRYVQIETTSSEDSTSSPSTACQLDLARLLVQELNDLGIQATLSEFGHVVGHLPGKGSVFEEGPTIGLIAHMDTSPNVSGKNVSPQLVKYAGGDIPLPNGTTIPESNALRRSLGHTLVTSDGSTLLGADNKAGIAAIMTLLEKLRQEQKDHLPLAIAFTPDEEVGRGTEHFDLKSFAADFAYTVDGELPGELNQETFTASSAILNVLGRDIHPGSAKDVMVNAIRIAADFVAQLPRNIAPETTDGYLPYIHPFAFEGSVASASVKLLLRAFDDPTMSDLQERLKSLTSSIQDNNPNAHLSLIIESNYRNMKEYLIHCPEALTRIETAARKAGVEPYWAPIRGGTDGSRLSEMGLPTPNIYTGGANFHSPQEWLSVEFLNQTVDTLLYLVAPE